MKKQSEILPKSETIHFQAYAPVRRHSRVLYIPLDATLVRLKRIKKGDILRWSALELIRAPSPDEEIGEEEC
jgi:hypothetical protein